MFFPFPSGISPLSNRFETTQVIFSQEVPRVSTPKSFLLQAKNRFVRECSHSAAYIPTRIPGAKAEWFVCIVHTGRLGLCHPRYPYKLGPAFLLLVMLDWGPPGRSVTQGKSLLGTAAVSGEKMPDGKQRADDGSPVIDPPMAAQRAPGGACLD